MPAILSASLMHRPALLWQARNAAWWAMSAGCICKQQNQARQVKRLELAAKLGGQPRKPSSV